MASIRISELRPAGSELFQDSESFLTDLGAQEMGITGGASVVGGISVTVTQTVTQTATQTQTQTATQTFTQTVSLNVP
ncbi:hypothetical protein [Nostoc sphaeroides]|uniref:Uncharacterized protein n=1 Tax=Nostoc sphaeroides CCNUC1 TaxID=2653204 RepID=A0A5P8WBI7_9NOSO|nr:hypothetical protein [Nostoc sphaeroides]QFS50153.1 hypothetical protein GXM_07647 [Nostoc sphaeroides CCNUC1]